MPDLIPINLSKVIHESLSQSTRPSDGLLHCSGDLVGSLRHTQLRAAGAPERENDLVSSIILETGTIWHRRVGQLLVDAGVPFMQEVRLDKWLPKGWGGTADWIFWHPEYEAFVLGDLKTTTGEGLPFIEREGIKTEHHHQLSAYWYALVDAGLPMVRGMAVLYLPKNRAKNYDTKPLLVEAEPLGRDYMLNLMNDRRELVDDYLRALGDSFMNDYLAPPIERVLKLAWNKDKWDVKLMPHWSAQFCPFDDDLCDCDKQGETKVGHYQTFLDDKGVSYISYVARKDYEEIDPPELTSSQQRRLYESS